MPSGVGHEVDEHLGEALTIDDDRRQLGCHLEPERVVTGDRDAYRYLPESVCAFPDAGRLAGMMSRAGLVEVRWRYFAGGSVALHTGVKP